MKVNQLTGADYLAARIRIGLSISATAKLTGVNRNTLSQFEQEKSTLDSDAKKRLLAFYQERGYDFSEQQTLDVNELSENYDEAQTGVVNSVAEKRSLAELGEAVLNLADTTHDLMSALALGQPQGEDLETIELPEDYLATHEWLQSHLLLDMQGKHKDKVGFFREDSDERSAKLIAVMAQQYLRILHAEMQDELNLDLELIDDDSDRARVLKKINECLNREVLEDLPVH